MADLLAPIRSEFKYGEHNVKIESGHIALQATSTAVVTMGDCVVMANITSRKCEGQDFFPLSVHYSERSYSAGKIPGSFNRREGRPSTREVLTCRVIDRAIRPMFAEGFTDEVQVTITLLQNDKNVQPDIAGFIAASAALALTDMPFKIIGAARVGFTDDGFVLNPSLEAQKESRLDLIIAGTKESYAMVESSAKELSESQIQEAIAFGQESLQVVINAIESTKKMAGTEQSNWQSPEKTNVLNKVEKIEKKHKEDFEKALSIASKVERNAALKSLRETIISDETSESNDAEHSEQIIKEVDEAIYHVKKAIIRHKAVSDNCRIDGRKTDDIRPITVIPSFLPKTHGSALFIRGETQALVTTTLSAQDSSAQLLDDITSSIKQYDNFMLHYNMPGYSVGECGFPMSPKRREIGHGELAKKALMAVLPDEEGQLLLYCQSRI